MDGDDPTGAPKMRRAAKARALIAVLATVCLFALGVGLAGQKQARQAASREFTLREEGKSPPSLRGRVEASESQGRVELEVEGPAPIVRASTAEGVAVPEVQLAYWPVRSRRRVFRAVTDVHGEAVLGEARVGESFAVRATKEGWACTSLQCQLRAEQGLVLSKGCAVRVFVRGAAEGEYVEFRVDGWDSRASVSGGEAHLGRLSGDTVSVLRVGERLLPRPIVQEIPDHGEIGIHIDLPQLARVRIWTGSMPENAMLGVFLRTPQTSVPRQDIKPRLNEGGFELFLPEGQYGFCATSDAGVSQGDVTVSALDSVLEISAPWQAGASVQVQLPDDVHVTSARLYLVPRPAGSDAHVRRRLLRLPPAGRIRQPVSTVRIGFPSWGSSPGPLVSDAPVIEVGRACWPSVPPESRLVAVFGTSVYGNVECDVVTGRPGSVSACALRLPPPPMTLHLTPPGDKPPDAVCMLRVWSPRQRHTPLVEEAVPVGTVFLSGVRRSQTYVFEAECGRLFAEHAVQDWGGEEVELKFGPRPFIVTTAIVLDSEQNPIAGASVRFSEPGGGGIDSRTGEDGRAIYRASPRGMVDIALMDRSLRPSNALCLPGATVTFEAEDARTVVVSHGGRLFDARVVLRSASGGEYVFRRRFGGGVVLRAHRMPRDALELCVWPDDSDGAVSRPLFELTVPPAGSSESTTLVSLRE